MYSQVCQILPVYLHIPPGRHWIVQNTRLKSVMTKASFERLLGNSLSEHPNRSLASFVNVIWLGVNDSCWVRVVVLVHKRWRDGLISLEDL